jgi:hypothetical protein
MANNHILYRSPKPAPAPTLTQHDTDSIHIIGFPKSGTTWLCRLVCDTLRGWRAPGMPGAEEQAKRANIVQGLQPGVGPVVRHTHLLPPSLLEYRGTESITGIYIVRDFRDVLVSGFFFRHSTDHQALLAKHRPIDPAEVLAAPWTALKRQYWRRASRRAFRKFVSQICLEGWAPYGTWTQHVREWRAYATADPCSRIAFISYETLKTDTPGTLRRAFDVLAVEQPTQQRLAAAVERHSAKRTHALPRREETNGAARAGLDRGNLRKGIIGDHRNYMTRTEAQLVQRTHGQLLRELGYIDDPDWVNTL